MLAHHHESVQGGESPLGDPPPLCKRCGHPPCPLCEGWCDVVRDGELCCDGACDFGDPNALDAWCERQWAREQENFKKAHPELAQKLGL